MVLSGFKLALEIKLWSLKVGCPLTGVCDTNAPVVWYGLVSFPTCATEALSFANEITSGKLQNL